MARAVEQALSDRHHLIVEAGTGVGKSFAYLLPAILKATSGDKGAKPVVISTATIALQEQLVRKDIPFLRSVWDREFTAVLAKGRSNYISLRRMQLAAERAGQGDLFEGNQRSQLEDIVAWSATSGDGSRSDLGFAPDSGLWEQVVSDSNNCMGKKCPQFDNCFYQRARRRVFNAHVLIVNHHLLFADLALKKEGVSYLPDYDYLILDEAHEIENIASDSLGIRLSRGQVEYFLRRLFHPRTGKGLFSVHPRLLQHEGELMRARDYADQLFDEVFADVTRSGNQRRYLEAPQYPLQLAEALRVLYLRLNEEARLSDVEEAQLEIASHARRALALSSSLESWVQQDLDGQVYWAEANSMRQGNQVELRCAPIHVGSLLREYLFDELGSVVLTSATLATSESSAREGSFSYLRERLGLGEFHDSLRLHLPNLLQDEAPIVPPASESADESEEEGAGAEGGLDDLMYQWGQSGESQRDDEARELMLGSPFNYQEQASLLLPDLPEPNSEGYEAAMHREIVRLVRASRGGSFVLFTSYSQLRRSFDAVKAELSLLGCALFKQGEGLTRERMLELFKSSQKAVLFGTDSFWQGIDVPGDALTTVIITRLPFAVPTDPIVASRMEAIDVQGRSSFNEYSVPQAIIKLKQGFGRLIRRRTDVGVVAILDSRIRKKAYGKRFIKALPPARLLMQSEPTT